MKIMKDTIEINGEDSYLASTVHACETRRRRRDAEKLTKLKSNETEVRT